MLAVATDASPEALAADRRAHARCHDAIASRGVDLVTFGTATTVEDYEWVRRALGIARWNVVGESYGTTVAMTLMVRHPESIRSVVLDSLNPPDVYFGMPWSARVASARETFFAEAKAGLRIANGDALASAYREVVQRLRSSPPLVRLPPALHVPDDQVMLTPSLFEEVVGRLVYYPVFYPDLPRLVTATRDGDLSPVRTALVALLGGAKQAGNEGAFAAVECRDRPHWREPARPDASPLDLALLPPGVCATWSALGPEPELPHDAAMPTLVLQGEFDPNIRPEQSRNVADAIGVHAHWVEFAGIGHSVRHYSACAQQIVSAFIDVPDRTLDTACSTQSATKP